jgi:hypothetical protein
VKFLRGYQPGKVLKRYALHINSPVPMDHLAKTIFSIVLKMRTKAASNRVRFTQSPEPGLLALSPDKAQ